jgi:hypothetical protein
MRQMNQWEDHGITDWPKRYTEKVQLQLTELDLQLVDRTLAIMNEC